MNKPAIHNMELPCVVEVKRRYSDNWKWCFFDEDGLDSVEGFGSGYNDYDYNQYRLASGIWHPWAGGECPVDEKSHIMVEGYLNDKLILLNTEARQIPWQEIFGRFKILEYK